MDQTLHDVLEESQYGRNFTWKEYIGRYIPEGKCTQWGRRELSYRIAHLILSTYLRIIIREILENNVQVDFRLQRRTYMSWLVADRHKHSEKYRYNVSFRGHNYIPYVIVHPNYWRYLKRYLILELNKTAQRRLERMIREGKEYEKAPSVIKKPFHAR